MCISDNASEPLKIQHFFLNLRVYFSFLDTSFSRLKREKYLPCKTVNNARHKSLAPDFTIVSMNTLLQWYFTLCDTSAFEQNMHAHFSRATCVMTKREILTA